jgi:NADPH:quinone reductase-like Zn-dependent oxidoreductase
MTTATVIELPGVGEPETLTARTITLPEPGPTEARVRVEATGISFAEQQMRLGKYYDQPSFPFVPGYDLVGIVEALGGPTADLAVGQRVAALTKVGGWADRVVLDVRDLVPVPAAVGAQDAETVVVNGITAWRMLHRTAKVQRGQTIVVLGAAGGVGTTLTQLARHAGIRVIGVAGTRQQATVEALGAIAVDYRTEDVAARVRALAPEGVAAVFDHVGGPGIVASWRMLARGGKLVSYGTAATKDQPGNPSLPVLKLLARLTVWNLAPNGRRASFFNLWAGHKRHRDRYRTQLREDLGRVLDLVAGGEITPQIAATYPLDQAAAALRRAEEGGLTGKIILVP